MTGYVALHREAFSHPLLKDDARFRAWFWLVAHAAWKPTKHDARGHTITIDRGQLCAGREYLAKEWGWSPSAVERFLARLETEQMIERKTGQMKTVITICNYDKYQDGPNEAGHMSGQETEQKSDRNRTAKEQGNKGTREPDGSHTPQSPPAEKATSPDSAATQGGKQPPKRRPDRGRQPLYVCEQPDDVSDQVWADFVRHRERLDADVTHTVITMFRHEADRLGWPLERALSESVFRRWQGFRAKWIENDERSKNSWSGSSQRTDGRSALSRAIDEGIDNL